jgi:hypothetical protein
VGRGPEQEKCTGDSAEKAGDEQGYQYSPGYIKALAIRASTGGYSGPESEGVGGVGGNRRHSDQQKGGKSHKATAPGDSVQSSAQDASDEKEYHLLRAEGGQIV